MGMEESQGKGSKTGIGLTETKEQLKAYWHKVKKQLRG